jgi:hypothetical protein
MLRAVFEERLDIECLVECYPSVGSQRCLDDINDTELYGETMEFGCGITRTVTT